jgi:hypothetical protein
MELGPGIHIVMHLVFSLKSGVTKIHQAKEIEKQKLHY